MGVVLAKGSDKAREMTPMQYIYTSLSTSSIFNGPERRIAKLLVFACEQVPNQLLSSQKSQIQNSTYSLAT